MSGVPALDPQAPNGLFGVLRSWLLARSNGAGPPFEGTVNGAQGPDAPLRSSARVLVVDDNPVNLIVMSALLESRGLVPLLAADGAEAVALACELHFDLILMDLQMPILDGLSATAAIRRFEVDHARIAVPVIAYSTSPPATGVLARHGVNGSLAKPCEDQELDDCLARWCPGFQPAAVVHAMAHGGGRWQSSAQALGR